MVSILSRHTRSLVPSRPITLLFWCRNLQSSQTTKNQQKFATGTDKTSSSKTKPYQNFSDTSAPSRPRLVFPTSKTTAGTPGDTKVDNTRATQDNTRATQDKKSDKKPEFSGQKIYTTIFPRKVINTDTPTYLVNDVKLRKKVHELDIINDKKLRIDYKNISLLENFVTKGGRILPRTYTGLTAKNQRRIRRTIKRARAIGLLRFTSHKLIDDMLDDEDLEARFITLKRQEKELDRRHKRASKALENRVTAITEQAVAEHFASLPPSSNDPEGEEPNEDFPDVDTFLETIDQIRVFDKLVKSLWKEFGKEFVDKYADELFDDTKPLQEAWDNLIIGLRKKKQQETGETPQPQQPQLPEKTDQTS